MHAGLTNPGLRVNIIFGLLLLVTRLPSRSLGEGWSLPQMLNLQVRPQFLLAFAFASQLLNNSTSLNVGVRPNRWKFAGVDNINE